MNERSNSQLRKNPDYLKSLLPYCSTFRQKQCLEAILETGSVKAAAEALNLGRSAIQSACRKVEAHAEKAGWPEVQSDIGPEYRAAAHGVKGLSTLRKTDRGELQWVKDTVDREQTEQRIKEFVEGLTSKIPPVKRTKIGKMPSDDDTLVAYPIGDHHYGMYAYAAQTGGDYDIKIARQILSDAVDYLVNAAPPSKQALLINLGDFLHMDDRTNKTPGSGHILDVDTRYDKVIKSASQSLRMAVERLLEKHRLVKIVNVPGNHDPNSTYWLSLVLDAYFSKEPRVEVEQSPAQYLFHEFGKNMLCMTHGDKVKLDNMPGVMASLKPEMWGRTKFRMCLTGHVHHNQRVIAKENHGAFAESFGVLPPNDQYNASMGYCSGREMTSIAFKREGGIISRSVYSL